MKKLLVLLAVLFAVSVASYGQLEDPPTEPSDRDWEVAPNIISGGYSDQEGPYIYKLFNVYSCPTLVYDRSHYYTRYYQAIVNIGYGEFQHHGGGGLICEDTRGGEVSKIKDETWAISYSYATNDSTVTQPSEYTGSYGPAYVYKRESIQAMSIAFSAESYTGQEGQKLAVNVFVIGGSGHYYGKTVKPAFLSTVGKLAYEGTCYDPVITSISTVVRDKVTGQECVASADIIITEKVDDPNDNPTNPSNPSNPPDPSDPSNPSNPSDPSDPAEPSEPSDPSNPDNPTEPSDPSDPNNPDSPDSPSDPDEPDSPDEPTEPDVPDTPNEPTDPSNPDVPDTPDEPDTPDTPDSPDTPAEPDEPVVVVPDPVIPDEPVVVPDNPETPSEPGDSEPSDESDEMDEVIIIDPTDPGNEDDEPTIIVVDRKSTDNDKIVVTDNGVTTVRPDNHDLAIFLGMFGAITGLSGSATTPSNAPMSVQQARQKVRQNK